MALNNIDTQFAVARSEIRALLKHVNPNTTVGGQACDALQGMIDALDSIQNDSFRHGISSFHRFPVLEDQPLNPDDEPTNPNFQAFKDLEPV
jgi:hypothetical protein